MSKKQIINLTVKGEIDFNGIAIKHIEGGFSQDSKVILVSDVAKIHEVEARKVNELINNNMQEFEEGIDLLDLRGENFEVLAKDLGFITSNNQKYCYILSEQGYLALACLMRTDKAREIRKQFRREYFQLKEEDEDIAKSIQDGNKPNRTAKTKD